MSAEANEYVLGCLTAFLSEREDDTPLDFSEVNWDLLRETRATWPEVVGVAIGLAASLLVELSELTGEPPLQRVRELALRAANRAS